MIWKRVNDSKTQRKFWMKRGKRGKCPIRSVVQIDKVVFDVCFLSISEKVERREVLMMLRTK